MTHDAGRFDVLVIGGGPAGSACAIRLAQGGARVGLVEATDFSRFRIGETIAPAVRPLLRRVAVDADDESAWAAPCAGVAAAWGQPTAARLPSLLNPYGRGWRVDRRAFDRMLFERAALAGATTFVRSRLASAARERGAWAFTLETRGDPTGGRATSIVAATGRVAAPPLASDRSRRYLDRLVGLATIHDARSDSRSSTPADALVEATAGGWWYSVTIPDGRTLAVFFTDSDLLPVGGRERSRFLREQLTSSPLTRARCAPFAQRIGERRWRGFDARSSIRRVVISDGWVVIGDAAMAFDPLCGRGVSEALTSGIDAAEWLLQPGPTEDDGPPRWVEGAARRFNRYCAERLAMYGHETRWTTSAFWGRRQPPTTASAPRDAIPSVR